MAKRQGDVNLVYECKCPVCGKTFWITCWQIDNWAFKTSATGSKVCSYKCLQEYRNNTRVYRSLKNR